MFRKCSDQLIQRCVPEEEMQDIFYHYHSLDCGGHFGGQRTTRKVLQSGFYYPTLFKDAYIFVMH